MKILKTTRKSFYKRIHGQFSKKTNPLGMGIDVTSGCNYGCVLCYQGCQKTRPSGKEMSKEQIFAILREAKKMGICHIQFSGGEPFFRKDFFEILEFVKRNGFLSTVFTNASLISEAHAARLALLRPIELDIPFYATDPVLFDKMTGVKNSFNAVKNALFFLKAYGIPVKLKMLVTRLNLSEASKVRDFAQSLGFPFRMDAKIILGENGDKALWGFNISPREEELFRKNFPEHCGVISHEAYKKGVVRKGGVKPFSCCTGAMFFNIDPFGKMGFCGLIGYPGIDVIKNGLRKSHQLLKKALTQINEGACFPCQGCDYIKYCDWCPADSYFSYRNFATCVPHLKRRAEYRSQAEKKEHAY